MKYLILSMITMALATILLMLYTNINFKKQLELETGIAFMTLSWNYIDKT